MVTTDTDPRSEWARGLSYTEQVFVIAEKLCAPAKMAADWSSVLETEDAMTLLHRVVFYGDHIDSVGHLARLMNLKVVEEG